jgi:hypothetical protein
MRRRRKALQEAFQRELECLTLCVSCTVRSAVTLHDPQLSIQLSAKPGRTRSKMLCCKAPSLVNLA